MFRWSYLPEPSLPYYSLDIERVKMYRRCEVGGRAACAIEAAHVGGQSVVLSGEGAKESGTDGFTGFMRGAHIS